MKPVITVLVLIVFSHLFISAQKLNENQYNFNFFDLSLQEALIEINSVSPLKLSYNPDIIPEITVNYAFNNKSISFVLNELLSPTHLDYQLSEKNIIIYERKDKTITKHKIENQGGDNKDSKQVPQILNNRVIGQYDTLDIVMYFVDTLKIIDTVKISDTTFFYDTLKIIDTVCVKSKNMKIKAEWKISLNANYYFEQKQINSEIISLMPFTNNLDSLFSRAFSYSCDLKLSRHYKEKYVSVGLNYTNYSQCFVCKEYFGLPHFKGTFLSEYVSAIASIGYQKNFKAIGWSIETGLNSSFLFYENISASLLQLIPLSVDISLANTLFSYYINAGLHYRVAENSYLSIKTGYKETLNSYIKLNDFILVYKGIGITGGLSIYF